MNTASFLKLWPLGENRVNLFLIPFFIFLSLLGLNFILKSIRNSFLTILLIGVLQILFVNSYLTIKKFALTPNWYYFYYRYGFIPINSRWGDGMKECTNFIKKNKGNENQKAQIILLHDMSEPLFGLYYYFYPNFNKKINFNEDKKVF